MEYELLGVFEDFHENRIQISLAVRCQYSRCRERVCICLMVDRNEIAAFNKITAQCENCGFVFCPDIPEKTGAEWLQEWNPELREINEIKDCLKIDRRKGVRKSESKNKRKKPKKPCPMDRRYILFQIKNGG